jgi:thiamine biosynthesis protein ThiS
MVVTVNGEPRTVLDGTTVAGLIAELGFREHRVAVEVNCDVVTREKYNEKKLCPGDAVEVVHFVGGG